MESSNFIISNQIEFNPYFDKPIAHILNDFLSPAGFHKNLPGYAPSPLYLLSSLATELGIDKIYLKNEAERFGIGTIKMLGASYAIHTLIKENPGIESFCTATDGNHGRSVAWSATRNKRAAHVFVPDYTVPSRIKNIEAEGGKVYKIHGNYDHAIQAALRFSNENNSILVQDFSFGEYREIPARITAGYYTQMKEIEEQTNNFSDTPGLIIVQCGNGSWPSAVVNFVRHHPKLKDVTIICVEPATADCMLESIKVGSLSTIVKSQKTLMAGLNCGTPSAIAYEILRHGVDAFLSIPDSYAFEAMKLLYKPFSEDPGIEAGESGAAGLAGLLALLKDPSLKILRKSLAIDHKTSVLIFNTEGITDRDFFDTFIA